MNKSVIILVDYLGFLRRYKHQSSTLNLEKITNIIKSSGFNCQIFTFQEIIKKNLEKNSFIWYSSSEFLSYKDYIEDILLNLDQSNKLIPHFDFFRAHNNKGFQELIKNKYGITSLWSHYFGTLEELQSIINLINFPVVLKGTTGSGSKNVVLIYNKTQLMKVVKHHSRCKYFVINLTKKMLKRYVFKSKYDYENSLESLHYKNYILQQFVPNLKNDWKVLVFYDKYYVLTRKNRKSDFRASGSGQFYYEEIDVELLNFCSDIRRKFNVPWLSLDVCFDGSDYHLIEYQMMHFGPITLLNSDYYYYETKDGWEKINKKSELSVEFAESFVKYLKANYY